MSVDVLDGRKAGVSLLCVCVLLSLILAHRFGFIVKLRSENVLSQAPSSSHIRVQVCVNVCVCLSVRQPAV